MSQTYEDLEQCLLSKIDYLDSKHNLRASVIKSVGGNCSSLSCGAFFTTGNIITSYTW